MTDDRVELESRLYFEIARQNRWWMSLDFRIGLKDAATLLGMSHGHLRNLISQGKGPLVCKLGGGGHQRTVKLGELAKWVLSRSS